MITIFVAEDHQIVHEALKRLLTSESDFQVIGGSHDGASVVGEVEKLKPKILLLDLAIPGLHGLEVLRKLSRQQETKIIVVSMHAEPSYVFEAFRNGAAGYVLKDSPATELLQAIRTVAKGNTFTTPSIK